MQQLSIKTSLISGYQENNRNLSIQNFVKVIEVHDRPEIFLVIWIYLQWNLSCVRCNSSFISSRWIHFEHLIWKKKSCTRCPVALMLTSDMWDIFQTMANIQRLFTILKYRTICFYKGCFSIWSKLMICEKEKSFFFW